MVPSSGTTPILNADGTSLLTDKEAILKRWAEHFDSVLNRPSSINDEAINRLPQVECNPLLDELPTVSVTVKAIKLLSSGKAPGSDAILQRSTKQEILQLQRNWQLFHIMWRKEAIPQEFKDATIIHLFKRKGNPQVCDNHRGISLWSIAEKILARVLLNRLNEHLECSGLLPESQCGFRKTRGRQLQDKCQEQNMDLYMTFVDLTKAFDAVSREGLWKIMAKFGCPAKFIAVVRQFHDGMLARVQNDGEFSDPFPVTNGVKQGCVLASTLFSMMLSAMLTDAFQDGDNGIPITYHFDGKLFNLRRLQAKSKVQTEVLDEFLFADDMAKGAPTEEKMQKDVDQVSDSCDSYDLTISIKKTEIVYQPAPGKPYKEPTITVKGQRLQVVDKFTYLGSTLSRVVHIDDEVNARIAKASAAFGRLRGSSWDRSWIRFDTKLKVYRSVVLPTLLYACETWTVYQRHAKRLSPFHKSCLRKFLKIKWQDRIPDTEVLKRAGMQSIHTLLKLAQLRWTGHVTRMPDERLPKKILYGELQVGKRSHGDQKKRYKDTLKASLKDFNIPNESWEQIAQNRTKWRGLIKRAVGEYEAKRISEAEQKRAQRKARAKASPTEPSSSDLSCSICNRQFRAKIGLISQLKTQK